MLDAPARMIMVRGARAAALAVTATAALALAAHLLAAARLRALLGFSFPQQLGIGAWWPIFAQNARLAAAALAAGALLGLIGQDNSARAGARAALDLCLLALAGVNIALVACAYGAWPARMAAYSIPYAPLELAGFAVAAGAYLQARQRPLPARQIALALGCSLSLLAASALIESISPPL
jgi:hypothetical protein